MPGFSMRGSGIYSETITREIICSEWCSSCQDEDKTCKAEFEQDLDTDDWGNVENDVTCEICKHTFTYKEERE